jgi:ribosome-associated translation inhibitor RaiA
MRLPFELHQSHITLPPADVQDIRERAEKLDHFFDRVMRCRVTVQGPGNHHRQGFYGVTIDVTVPRGEIVVHKENAASLDLALGAAFDATARRLEDYVHRMRGFIKAKAGSTE